jgi:hypothetical protein
MEPKKLTRSLAEFRKPTGEGLAWRLGNNDLPWVISYLTGLTGLIWLAHMAGTHLHLLHAA